MYEFWLFLHVLGAVTWVGGNIALNIVGTRLIAASPGAPTLAFTRQIEWVGTRVFTPASVLVLLAGIVMTIDVWSFEELWILIGLAGFLYSFINGAFFLGPLSAKTAGLMEERGTEDPEVLGNIRRLFVLGRIELVVLLIVVMAMTLKPTL
jgi:Predicted integral membrane protein (DUF2269)